MERYYSDIPEIANPLVRIRATYTNAHVSELILTLMKCAQEVLQKIPNPDDRYALFDSLLRFLEAYSGNTSDRLYIARFGVLDDTQFSNALEGYSLPMRVFLRCARTTGLLAPTPLAALRDELSRLTQDALFLENRSEILHLVRVVFEGGIAGEPFDQIQSVVHVLIYRFNFATQTLFNEVTELMGVLINTELPQQHRFDATARAARARMFDHAIMLQAALQDPTIRARSDFLRMGRGNTGNAGVRLDMGLHSRL
jgi:hypothetical protein